MVGTERVADWPQLKIVEHYVPHHEMRDRCGADLGFGMSPEACAQFDFAAGVCDIWFSADFPPPWFVVTHERQHCAGYEHVDGHELGTSLKRYLATLPRDPAHASASQGSSAQPGL